MPEITPVGPPSSRYDDVVHERVAITGRDGATVEAHLHRPAGQGRFPAIAIGAEGTGVNAYVQRVAATLAHHGFVAVVADPYRGQGPPDPEAYEDVETLMRFIGELDFTRAATDQLAAIAYLRERADVDPMRVGVWGYCTGATLALLAAELDPLVAAAVLFYPSQPTFEALGDTTPAHPIDLLWSINCPVLLIYGDDDVVMPKDLLDEVTRRLETWGIEHRIDLHAGAGHAFCAEAPMFFHHDAAVASWTTAVDFARQTLGA
jgi:carboxymethylenebutenolidase